MTRYVGKPCKRGHSGERYTGNRTCVACENARLRQKRRTDPEWAARRDAQSNEWAAMNPLARAVHQSDYLERKAREGNSD